MEYQICYRRHHLNNILTTITDRRIGVYDVLTRQTDHNEPEQYDSREYYAFGSESRRGSNPWTVIVDSKQGFNNKEKSHKTNSQTNYDYGFRIYNAGIGIFLSVDPLTKSYPFYSPYQFAGNKPIIAIDLDGLEEKIVINKIAEVDGVIKVIDNIELTAENKYHPSVGNFTDYANQEKYGTRDTLVVNEFLDPIKLKNGNKLHKYEYLNLTNWEVLKNAFTIKYGNGDIQKFGVAYTSEKGGPMQTKSSKEGEEAEIVDIGSLLFYWNYSKYFSLSPSTIREISNPQVMAEVADLIADIGELTLDKEGAKPNDNKKLDTIILCRSCNNPAHSDEFTNDTIVNGKVIGSSKPKQK